MAARTTGIDMDVEITSLSPYVSNLLSPQRQTTLVVSIPERSHARWLVKLR